MDARFDASGEYALSQPTRARLFALLSDLQRPAVTAELAERLGLHPNGVRVHLERMRRAGLVVRARTQQPRGRPPDAWTIAPQARPADAAPSADRDLGRREIPCGPAA
jgi:predicted ArsR family transcriptional regulator